MKPSFFVLLTLFLLMVRASDSVESKLNSRRALDYNSTSLLSECESCLADSSKKICSYSENSTYSYCCDSWDTSTYCGGTSSYECTTDSGISGNARYIL